MTEHLLTTHEAAAVLGLRPNTLAKWRLSGRGPRYRRLGRSIRYAPEDLQAFVDGAVATSTAEYMASETKTAAP